MYIPLLLAFINIIIIIIVPFESSLTSSAEVR